MAHTGCRSRAPDHTSSCFSAAFERVTIQRLSKKLAALFGVLAAERRERSTTTVCLSMSLCLVRWPFRFARSLVRWFRAMIKRPKETFLTSGTNSDIPSRRFLLLFSPAFYASCSFNAPSRLYFISREALATILPCSFFKIGKSNWSVKRSHVY